MQSDQCINCRHYRSSELACDAFPNGIPEEIITGQFDHSEPYEGDRGIRFEQIELEIPAFLRR